MKFNYLNYKRLIRRLIAIYSLLIEVLQNSNSLLMVIKIIQLQFLSITKEFLANYIFYYKAKV